MFGPQLCDNPNNITTEVLCKSARNNFHSISNCSNGQLMNIVLSFAELDEFLGDLHFGGSSSWQEHGTGDDVPANCQRILEIPLEFVEGVLAASSEQNGAGLGLSAFQKVGEVVIPYFLDLEQTTIQTDIRVLQLFGPVADGGSCDPGYSVVVGLPGSPDDADVFLHEEMLGEIAHSLFGDHHIGLELHDIVAHLGDFVDFLLQSVDHVVGLGHLHVGLTLALLVLQIAVEQQDSGISDEPPHLRMGHVLVQHHSVQNLAVLQRTARNLLHLRVPLDVHTQLLVPRSSHDAAHRLNRQVHDQVVPPTREFSPDATSQSIFDIHITVYVDLLSLLPNYSQTLLHCLIVPLHHDARVNLLLDKWSSSLHHLSSHYYHLFI